MTYNNIGSNEFEHYKWLLSSDEISSILLNSVDSTMSKECIARRYRLHFHKIAFACFISFVRVVFYYVKQYFIVLHSNLRIEYLFLNTGRGYEMNNVQKILQIDNRKVLSIYSYDVSKYMKYERVGLFFLMRNLYKSICDYRTLLSTNIHNNVFSILLKTGPQYISIYSYLKSFFIKFSEGRKGLTIYTSGSILASYAAISSSIKTINLYHGLMRKIHTHSFPRYHSTYVYSKDEYQYLLDTKVSEKVKIYPYENMGNRLNRIVIFMPSNIAQVNLSVIYDIMQFFHSFDFSIYIKTHPLNNAPKRLLGEYKIATYKLKDVLKNTPVNFRAVSGDGMSIVRDIKPSFSIGFSSTALCESLNMGSIPINVEISNVDVSQFVYPIHKRTFSWKLEREAIKLILLGNITYDNALKLLMNR
jgi:hypothetical protein